MAKLSIDQALLKAKSHAKKGEIEEAKKIYSTILNSYPKNIRAKEGLAALSKNRQEKPAGTSFQNAINSLLKKFNVGEFEATFNMATRLSKQFPNAFQIWHILGITSAQLTRFSIAHDAFDKAILLNPKFADAYNNKAVVLKEIGEFEEALILCEKAIELNSSFADAYNVKGAILLIQNKFVESVIAFNKAIEINPKFYKAYSNLANALRAQGELEKSIYAYKKALIINPNYAEAHCNMGNTLKDQGKRDEAIEAFNKALAIKPDYADAYCNMGRLHLLNEEFIKAFELMEWRWKQKKQGTGTYFKSRKPSWAGEDDKKVLVWKEQGIGDEIMFSSMLYELHERTKKLIVECDKRLIPLYKRSFPEGIEFVDDREKVDERNYDSHIAIGSLPRHFRSNIADFSKISNGWILADSVKVNQLRKNLAPKGKVRLVGISWSTNSSKEDSSQRSIPTDLIAKYLGEIPVKYINLQYGDTAQDILRMHTLLGMDVHHVDKLDLFNDLDGLSTLISACDIVISIDNVTANLAGALGIDTRLLLPLTADERWGLKRNDSYWYESLKLYRQEKFGDWHKPLETLALDLKKLT